MNHSTNIYYSSYYNQFRIIQNILTKISFPYIFLVGFVGLITNTTTVVLLSKSFITKSLKNKWTLIALALSDLLFNSALVIRGIHDLSKQRSSRLCIIISFVSHLAELLSACYTVSFTIQRYTAVRYPLKAATDRRSSPIISLLILLLCSSLFCAVLIHANLYVECHEELKLIWFIADALFSFVIPFFLILIFNILIVNFIRKHSRSPISVQSTLLRKKKQFKTTFKTCHHDETSLTDNNTMLHADEWENIPLKTRKESQNGMINHHQGQRPSNSWSFDQMNFEFTPNSRSSQTAYRSSVVSRSSIQPRRFSSHDSFIYRFSGKSSSQSNDNGIVATISTRTSQSIRVTRMLVLVSTCFLILNAPAHISVIALKIYSSIDSPTVIEETQLDQINRTGNKTLMEYPPIIEDKLTPHVLYVVIGFAHWIAYASYSINFFLYSFSGITFRTSLRQLIRKFRRHS